MGTGEMPLLVPVTRSVSASISRRTSSKSVNFFPLQCKNSAYSAPEAGWGEVGGRGGGSPGSYLSLGLELHPKHCLLLLPRNNASSPSWAFIPTVQTGNRGPKRGSPAYSHTASSFSGEAGPSLEVEWRAGEASRTAGGGGHVPVVALTSCRTSGRLVTMPDPRGRKSLQ